MGEVVAIQKPIEKLVLEIRGHVHDAGRAETTCAKHQLQAGRRLLELRDRVEAGEAGGNLTWWEWYEEQFTGHIRSRKYAERLMKWARADDPEGAIQSDNDAARERMARVRSERSLREHDAAPADQAEYDIVEHALRLVAKMSADERENFDETYRREYP